MILLLSPGLKICLIILLIGCKTNSTALETSQHSDQAYTVMTYNVLCGAGVDSSFAWCQQQSGVTPGNKLEKVIRLIEEINPDILGIQEALRWEHAETGTARQLAQKLNMNFVLGPSIGGDHHIVLYTKFDIVETENYFQHFSRATLRAKLMPPGDVPLQIFVTHLFPNPNDARWQEEYNLLVSEVLKYRHDQTFVIGDFNNLPERISFGSDFRLLHDNQIDQIWASKPIEKYFAKKPYFKPIPIQMEHLGQISDHDPVAIMLGIFE